MGISRKHNGHGLLKSVQSFARSDRVCQLNAKVVVCHCVSWMLLGDFFVLAVGYRICGLGKLFT
jgi:CobQ-like glutamine amidotransferase family enzyme